MLKIKSRTIFNQMIHNINNQSQMNNQMDKNINNLENENIYAKDLISYETIILDQSDEDCLDEIILLTKILLEQID